MFATIRKWRRRMTSHYKTRRILCNLFVPVPFLLIFSGWIMSDFSNQIHILRKRLPNMNQETKWNSTLTKVFNATNSSEVISLLHDLRVQIQKDIESMS